MDHTITMNWAAIDDPAVGWRVYICSGGNALVSTGQVNPDIRSFEFHNITPGLWTVGVARVDSILVGTNDTPIQSDVRAASALIIGDDITLDISPAAPSLCELEIGDEEE